MFVCTYLLNSEESGYYLILLLMTYDIKDCGKGSEMNFGVFVMIGDTAVYNVLSIIDDGLITGRIDFKTISNKLHIIAECGFFVKNVIHNHSIKKTDPVMRVLFELNSKMSRLFEEMNWGYNGLEIENVTFLNLIHNASTLIKFMQDTISHPCHESLDIFRDAYFKTPPLQSSYRLLSILELESSNPLKQAMKADKLRKAETFEIWREVIDAVFTQFLTLETYINGMFWDKNMYGPNQLKGRIEKLNKQMDQWWEDYKNSYWDTVVERLIHETQDNNTHVSNEEKAQILHDSLISVLSDDSFYVIVYNDTTSDRHAFCKSNSQYIASFGRGMCNVIVYRSRCYNRATTDEQETFENYVESCRNEKIDGKISNETVTKSVKENRIKNCNFVAMIDASLDVEIRGVNTPGHELGPGWWITVKSESSSYRLIAGFK